MLIKVYMHTICNLLGIQQFTSLQSTSSRLQNYGCFCQETFLFIYYQRVLITWSVMRNSVKRIRVNVNAPELQRY